MMPAPDFDDREIIKRLVTALENDAPMTRAELDIVRAHFAELARLMLVSGTSFAAMRHIAMKLHNRAVARIAGAVPNPARQREREREEERLLPIEP
jgi:hypothetical protein